MSYPPAVRLGLAVARRASLLGLTRGERSAALLCTLRDYARRTGARLDRRQPGPPCCMVPAAGVRVDVIFEGASWRYNLRREPE